MPPVERTLWICCDDEQVLRDSLALLRDLSRNYPRLVLLFTSGRRGRRDWLSNEFPHPIVAAAPLAMAPFPSLFLARWRVQAVLFLTPPRLVGGSVRAAIQRANIPAVSIHGEATVPDRERNARIEPFEALTDILRRDPKHRREQSRTFTARGMRTLQQSQVGQALLRWRTHRIEDFDSLGAELGNPGTILCLGNGPSSENPQLLEIGYDCLFRVNSEWKERRFLTHAEPRLHRQCAYHARGSIGGLLLSKCGRGARGSGPDIDFANLLPAALPDARAAAEFLQ